jgi:p-aminobenzoyl-glutamate transporter AbgT
MDHMTIAAIKRQVPFLIAGTVTGIIMSYYLSFLVTVLVNTIVWYLISLIVYKLVWRNGSLTDQKILLRYFLTRIKWQIHIQTA